MKYYSTRGFDKNESFTDIILEGLAPDGGLYMPKTYPNIINKLNLWQDLTYNELAFEVLQLFCDDIPTQDLKDICDRTYTANTYKYTRSNEAAHEITPLTILEHSNKTLCLLALSNGPTLAFKDMAMQFLGNLFDYVLDKKQQKLNILGATSGDTGSAAEYAMRNKDNIKVFMLSPHNKMSPFQQAQMFSLMDKNIFNIAIEGFFDNCQDIVKAVSNDREFKTINQIGTVNSINWARIVAQIVYYVKGYLNAIKQLNLKIGDKVSFSVPSGNFGNICAGHIAKQMGLPIDKLIACTNENDVLDITFKTGKYIARSEKQTEQTSSPSMDISKASNFERFVFDYNKQNTAKTKQQFEEFSKTNYIDFSINQDYIENFDKFGFVSSKSTHAHRLDIIRDVYKRYNIIIDPHTADGVKGAREYMNDNIPMIVLETAQASKFESVIQSALGFIPQRHSDFMEIENKAKNLTVLDNDLDKVKGFIQKYV